MDEHKEALQTQLAKFGDSSQRCLSPLCRNRMEPKSKHAAVKFYCSVKCKIDAWAVHRAALLLADFHPSVVLQVLAKARNHGGTMTIDRMPPIREELRTHLRCAKCNELVAPGEQHTCKEKEDENRSEEKE